MSIKEKITYYKESLDFFNDTMEKYRFLLDQGKTSTLFPEEYRQDSFKVSGCQAQVWLVPYMKYASNASIIKTEWSLNWKSAVGCGTLIYISYGLVLMALEKAKVSYVWPVRESGILVGLVLGYFVLKEPIQKTSGIGCLMIVTGVVTIATAS